MNNVVLLGRLTRDPELKNTSNGNAVVSFSLAVNRNFKNADGNYEADFISCVAWRHTAEYISKCFKKGDSISLRGRLQVRSFDDSEGKKRYITEVIVEEAGFGGGKKAEQPAAESRTQDEFELLPEDEDLPF